MPSQSTPSLKWLHDLAARVIDSAQVDPGDRVSGTVNTTGFALHLPGSTTSHYRAFWVRDAAMMLGADFLSAEEVEGWVRLIASTQAGPEGLRFPRELFVPPYSIPDHITLEGAACWYPGANAEQGEGTFGFLPPADDAFYFIQMVREHARLTGQPSLFLAPVQTSWGQPPLWEVCARAFDAVAVNAEGLVVCSGEKGQTRVDWGFCDTVRKVGACLMPSLLRWQAARDLEALFLAIGEGPRAQVYGQEAARLQAAIPHVFYQALPAESGAEVGRLLSATERGRKADVWATAYALWLGILPRPQELAVARHLLALYQAGGTIVEGQVRHLPPEGDGGGYWEECVSAPETYQNGGYWGTPTGWYIAALERVDPASARKLLEEFVAHLRQHDGQGAPWEWIHPARGQFVNPLYAASVGLPYIALAARSKTPAH